MWASHCGGFSCCRARALGHTGSVVVACGLYSCSMRALECRPSSCGPWAYLLRGMWDLPRPGLEPVSPALEGRFLTTAPPGKSLMGTSKDTNLRDLCYLPVRKFALCPRALALWHPGGQVKNRESRDRVLGEVNSSSKNCGNNNLFI